MGLGAGLCHVWPVVPTPLWLGASGSRVVTMVRGGAELRDRGTPGLCVWRREFSRLATGSREWHWGGPLARASSRSLPAPVRKGPSGLSSAAPAPPRPAMLAWLGAGSVDVGVSAQQSSCPLHARAGGQATASRWPTARSLAAARRGCAPTCVGCTLSFDVKLVGPFGSGRDMCSLFCRRSGVWSEKPGLGAPAPRREHP